MTSSNCITVSLPHGYSTIIDKIDSDLIEFKWHAHVGPTGRVYVRRDIYTNGRKTHIWLHKIIYCRSKGLLIPPEYVDHIDNNPLNNLRSNLREVTRSQNLMNSKKRNKTGLKGAYYNKRDKHWNSSIVVNNKYIYLGYFETAEEAHDAYCKASKKYHGEFGRVE